MLFSEEKWNNAEEINELIPVSSALSFEKVKSSLQDAEELFMVHVLGNEMMVRVQYIYDKGASDDFDSKLLRICQRAEANIAFWYNFDELNVRITDQGVQRQTTENFTSAYKYQEDSLKNAFKTKGLNALDMAIDFLMLNKDKYNEFLSSEAFRHRNTAFVKSLEEADKIYCIYKSPLVWLRIQPIIAEIEETILPNVLGKKCMNAIIHAMENEEKTIGNTTTEELRSKVARYIVTLSISMLLKRGGTLTDRGLYFQREVATNLSGTASLPADLENSYKLSKEIGEIAIRRRNILSNFIREYCPDLYGGAESDVLNRDNDDHRAVFL